MTPRLSRLGQATERALSTKSVHEVRLGRGRPVDRRWTTATPSFTDDESNTHEVNINRLRAAGITTGCTATTYCPTQTVIRGQMAAFLHRAFD